MCLHAEGEYGGAKIDLKGLGYEDKYESNGSVDIQDGKTTALSYVASGMKGQAHLFWIAQQVGTSIPVPALRIKLLEALRTPLPLDGIPFMLEVSVALIVQPGLIAVRTYTGGHALLKFIGDEGIKGAIGMWEEEGKVDTSGEIDHDTSIAGVGPAGWLVALEMPRIELSLGVLFPLTYLGALAGPWGGLLTGGIAAAEPFSLFAYVDLVLGLGAVTSGTAGSLPLGPFLTAPCVRVSLEEAGYVALGVKLDLGNESVKKGALGKFGQWLAGKKPVVDLIQSVQGATRRNLFGKIPILGPREIAAYKWHPAPSSTKCLGD
jgi:hypothetical protein